MIPGDVPDALWPHLCAMHIQEKGPFWVFNPKFIGAAAFVTALVACSSSGGTGVLMQSGYEPNEALTDRAMHRIPHTPKYQVILGDNSRDIAKFQAPNRRRSDLLTKYGSMLHDSHVTVTTEAYGEFIATRPAHRRGHSLELSPKRVVYVLSGTFRSPLRAFSVNYASGKHLEVHDAETGRLLEISIDGKGTLSRKPSGGERSPRLMGNVGYLLMADYPTHDFSEAGIMMPKPQLTAVSGGNAEMFVGQEAAVNGGCCDGFPASFLNAGFNLGPINMDFTGAVGSTDFTGPLVVNIMETNPQDISFDTYTFTYPSGDVNYLIVDRETNMKHYAEVYANDTVKVSGIYQPPELLVGSGTVWDSDQVGLWGSPCTLAGWCVGVSKYDGFPNPITIQDMFTDSLVLWPAPSQIAIFANDPSGQATASVGYTKPGGVPTLKIRP